jgi:N-acetylneuraminic acid mutarotase
LTKKSPLVKKPLQKPLYHRNNLLLLEISMGKRATLLLALVFLLSSCLSATKPALSSAGVAEDTWVSKAPMHMARYGLGVAVVNGKIYAIGGLTKSGGGGTKSGPLPYEGGVVGTNEEYDPVTGAWIFKAPMPTPLAGFGIAVYQNKIYCISSEVNEVYDPSTDTWENRTPMPTARFGLQANVVNGKIYLIGGYVPDNSSYGFSPSTFNEVYDPSTDSWTVKAPLQTASSIYASAVVDNKIYIIGGDGAGELNQIYDSEMDKWSLGAPLSSSTAYGAAGATADVNAPERIYVLGQYFHLSEQPYFNRVYDPENDSWAVGVAVPTKRAGLGVAVVNDLLYAIGGYTETYPSDILSMPYGPSITPCATNEQYTPFGYGTVPPEVSVVSPENKTYAANNVSLIFTVNKPVVWLGFSLDGKEAVTVTGNTTLSGLSSGLHNITVYANDTFGNAGASEAITFTVATEPKPSQATLIAAASGASVAVVGIGLFLYLKKRNRRSWANLRKENAKGGEA